jgi:predicted RNA-binding protein with RPS1 domain
MTRIPLASGDVIDVVIVKVLPFGALVETGSGVPGLVRGAVGDIGATLSVQVNDVDEAEHRFSARLT